MATRMWNVWVAEEVNGEKTYKQIDPVEMESSWGGPMVMDELRRRGVDPDMLVDLVDPNERD
jgi:hypothetical protein